MASNNNNSSNSNFASSAHSRGIPPAGAANSNHSRGNLSPKPAGAWGKGNAAAAAAVRAAPPPSPAASAAGGLSPVPSGGAANRVRAFSGGNVVIPQQGTFASTSSHHRRKRFSHPNPNNKGAGSNTGGGGGGGTTATPGRGIDGGGGGGGGGSQRGTGSSFRNRHHNHHHGGGVGAASPGGGGGGGGSSRRGTPSSHRSPHLPPHIASAVPPPPSLTPTTTTPKQPQQQQGANKQQQHHHHHNHNHHHNHHQNNQNKKRDLLTTGQGSTPAQRAVQRVTAEVMLQLRLTYLDPPPAPFTIPEGCLWTNDPSRITQIEEMVAAKRIGGEVSKVGVGKPHHNNSNNNNNATAPPLEECAPLQVNEETRWKPKIFSAISEQPPQDTMVNSFSAEDIFAKALLVLNKLSWTTMDKLSQELMKLYWDIPPNAVMIRQVPQQQQSQQTTDDTTTSSSSPELESTTNDAVEVLRGIIRLIVQKAQAEPHFAGMYAQLCATLHKLYSNKAKEDNLNKSLTNLGDASSNSLSMTTTTTTTTASSSSSSPPPQSQRLLKKLLLQECQEAFHQDSMQRLQEITTTAADADEIAYHANLLRQHYVGLMRFLGELYCRDLIKIDIMIWCLKHLLQLEKADELSTTGDSSNPNNQPPEEKDNSNNSNDKTENGSATILPAKSRDEDVVVEEEKLECFAKLITTIGSMLEQQALSLRQNGKPKPSLELQVCWEYVYLLAGRSPPPPPLDGSTSNNNSNNKNSKPSTTTTSANVSSRLKFMLQDLIDLKENGWVSRRAVETAKTISELHQDVAKEAAAAQQQARRSSSSGNLRAALGAATSTTSPMPLRRTSTDGRGASARFKQQQQQLSPKPGRGYTSSSSTATVLRRSVSDGSSLQRMASASSTSAAAAATATASNGSAAAAAVAAAVEGGRIPPPLPPLSDNSNNNKAMPRSKSMSVVDDEKASIVVTEDEPTPTPPPQQPSNTTAQSITTTKYPSPEVCGDKMKKVLREYFVGGDVDEAILSIHEIVGATEEGSIDRGAKVVEAGVLLVLEMKVEEVKKFIHILDVCVEKGEIEKESFAVGLYTPLEFLSEIEIDAPLAGSHMVAIVSELKRLKMLSLEFLCQAPEMFLSEGKAAKFAARVIKAGNGSVSGEDIQVIANLMTEDDKAAFTSAGALLSAVYESTAT